MVVGELTDDELDRLFHALADATRRDILIRCVRGEPSVSRLADDYPMGRVLYDEWAAYWPEHAGGDAAQKLTDLKARDGGDTYGPAKAPTLT